VFMYAIYIQNDVIGLVLREICKSKQLTDGRVRKIPKMYYLNVWNVSDPIVEVNAVVTITVTTSTYHSRRCSRL
jgi:hypothetical protein